jgi:hypothetical protein
MKAKGKPKDLFNHRHRHRVVRQEPGKLLSAVRAQACAPGEEDFAKAEEADVELDFDSLKSNSSVPVSTPQAAPKRSLSVCSTEKPKIAEKTPKVPSVKRKATHESEPSDELDEPPVDETPSKKPRKSSQNPSSSPQRKEPSAESSSRRSAL